MADENEMVEDTEKKPSEKPIVPRSATELQKLKLEKLMKDPVSRNPVIIRDCSSRYIVYLIMSLSVEIKSCLAG